MTSLPVFRQTFGYSRLVLITLRNGLFEFLRIWFNRYGKKLIIAFQHLSILYRICENHKNWSKIVARRAVSIFQTGFSHPVDPEFRIFFGS